MDGLINEDKEIVASIYTKEQIIGGIPDNAGTIPKEEKEQFGVAAVQKIVLRSPHQILQRNVMCKNQKQIRETILAS